MLAVVVVLAVVVPLMSMLVVDQSEDQIEDHEDGNAVSQCSCAGAAAGGGGGRSELPIAALIGPLIAAGSIPVVVQEG